jgi:hypothetical protein
MNRGLIPWGEPLQDLQSTPTQRNPQRGTSTLVPPSAAFVLDPHHYANIIELFVPVTTAAVQPPVLTAPDTRRNFLMLRNCSTTIPIVIGWGKMPTANSVLYVAPGSPGVMVLFDVVVPQDDMYALAIGGSADLAIGYSTISYPDP